MERPINYFDIIRQAYLTTWKNKFLWFFGLLIFFNSLLSNLNLYQEKLFEKIVPENSISRFFASYPEILTAANIIFLFIVICFIFINISSHAAIIKSAAYPQLFKQLPIKATFYRSLSYFPSLLKMELIIDVAVILIGILLFLPILFLLSNDAFLPAGILLVVATLGLLILLIIAFFLKKFAYLYIILGNMSLKATLEQAYALFEKNMRACLKMGIINLAFLFGILSTLAVFFIILFLAFIPLLTSLFLIAKGAAFFIGLIITFLSLTIAITIISCYNVFIQLLWFYFFQQLSLEKKSAVKFENSFAVDRNIASPEPI